MVSESLERPSHVQILARNLLRILELDRVFLILLAVMFLTPHRQRIGDLIARTIVIEDQPVETGDEQEDDRIDGSDDDDGS